LAPLQVIEVVVLPLGLANEHLVLPPVDRHHFGLVLRPPVTPHKIA
jgi:hypothetical protein